MNHYRHRCRLRLVQWKGQGDLRSLGRRHNHRGPMGWWIQYRIAVAKAELRQYPAYHLRHHPYPNRLEDRRCRDRTVL